MELSLLFKFIRNMKWHCLGKCTVCGRRSLFLCLYDQVDAQNQMSCIFCHSSSRKRHVAKIIRDIFCFNAPFKHITSTGISIYNTERKTFSVTIMQAMKAITVRVIGRMFCRARKSVRMYPVRTCSSSASRTKNLIW